MKQLFNKAVKSKTGQAILGTTALFLGYQLFGPNTSYDRLAAKQVWCDVQEQATEPRVVEMREADSKIARGQKLDWTFKEMRNRDTIRYGSLEIKAVDSRGQRSFRTANKHGVEEQMISLTCPGYIKMDVYHHGKLVPGGSGVEVAYAAKFLGSGGLFDGWPDFSLEDVLEMTDLSSKEIDNIVNEGARIESERRQKRYEQARAKRVSDHREEVDANPELTELIRKCKGLFRPRSDGNRGFEYTVKRGDSKIGISRTFNDCNFNGAFFPYLYSKLDTIQGSDIGAWEERDPRINFDYLPPATNVLRPGQTVYINPKAMIDLAKPEFSEYE